MRIREGRGAFVKVVLCAAVMGISGKVGEDRTTHIVTHNAHSTAVC